MEAHVTVIDFESVPRWSNTTTSTSVFGDGRISAHADPTRGPWARPRRPRHGKSSHGAGDAGDSSDFGLLGSLWGSKVPHSGRFPALEADEPLY